MTTLSTDGGWYEISKKATDLLRSLFIEQYESEPYHQYQNKAEQRYGVVKRYINTIMNLTGAPAHCWLLCLLYVCNLLNATASPALGGLTPCQALTGQVPDISHFLHFSFWEPIYYKEDESEPDHRFPSQSNERRGHWVGFADNKGDHLTWKILTDNTNTIIIRSAVSSATKTSPNLRLDPPKGEDQPQDLTSDVFVYGRPNPDGSDNTPPMNLRFTYGCEWGEKEGNAPKGHQKIRVHFVFDVKHCGKFKARPVAVGHLTKEPMETVYSGVVSIRNLRLAMFLAELNNLELWGADVGNAYLQALTWERLYIVGGPEFEELQGHVLVMYKALYGTRSIGACWHDKFFDILHHMGFKPSRADPDIWMKSSKDGSHYEYIAVYVDDLTISMKDPKSFCDKLKEKYKLKLKVVG